MILICGIPSEPPVAAVMAAAARAGREVLVLNQRHAATTDLELIVSERETSLGLFDLSGVRPVSAHGAFVRMTDFRTFPEYGAARDAGQTHARFAAWHGMLSDWLEAAPYPVMNRLRPSASNASKPYQLQLIARLGWRVPQTLITNRTDDVVAFQARVGRVVFKSISSNRSIVRELLPTDADRLSRLPLLPTQFQEYVTGDDVRVHVVGGHVFATRIVSGAVDYRYASRSGESARFSPTTLPPSVEEACRKLSGALDLPLCGIDLKQADGGDFVCLEVNPSPAFSYFEEQTGQPIADAIVDVLGSPRRSAAWFP